jgi:hypothetical protein
LITAEAVKQMSGSHGRGEMPGKCTASLLNDLIK